MVLLCKENALAQSEYLVLEKTLTDRSVTFSSGDDITFKMKEEDFFRTNHIIALNDTAIEFHYYSVNYLEIDKVYLKHKRLSGFSPRQIGNYAQIAGLGYIAIDQFNQVLVRGEDASYNADVFLVGGLIFVGGTVLKFLEPRKVRVGGKYRLRYMNLTTY
ncbi:MAG: hypothetical protein U5K79_04970 [Cyclobacteriaceae bacterium]|nr:hypothetical protein [Cyclobacteriaceae bacterium]